MKLEIIQSYHTIKITLSTFKGPYISVNRFALNLKYTDFYKTKNFHNKSGDQYTGYLPKLDPIKIKHD